MGWCREAAAATSEGRHLGQGASRREREGPPGTGAKSNGTGVLKDINIKQTRATELSKMAQKVRYGRVIS
jgi:hypothetical protein